MSTYDEAQSPSGMALAKRAHYLENVQQLISDYEELVESERDASKALRTLRQRLSKAEAQLDTQKHRIEKLSADKARLVTVAEALRKSSSLRVGKAVMLPWRASKRLLRDASLRSIPTKDGVNGSMVREASAPSNEATTSREEKLRQWTSAVDTEPTVQNLYNLVAFRYFKLGELREPARLLQESAELAVEATVQQRRAMDTILGGARVLADGVFLPERQPNSGYVAEPGRIMYCVHSAAPYNSNGYSTRSHGIIQGLRKQGADFVVAVRPGYPWDVKTDRGSASRSSFEEEIDGARHLFSAGPSWTAQPLDSYVQYAADQYVQAAMQNRVSVIHAASNHVTALPALIAARRLGLPFVYEVRGFWEITEQSSKPGWEHTDRFALALKLETLVANEADQVLAITQQVAETLISRGVASERITLLPNSVDVNAFSPLPAHQKTLAKLGIPNGIPVIGYAGSVVEYEGLDLLIRATSDVLSRGIDVRTVIVGDGPALDGLKVLTEELQLKNHVKFTGRVPSSSVALYLSCFDVVPSPRRRLPVTELVPPLKPLEAMASGKAVILTDLPPLRDLAGADGERARLCEPESSVSLADVIEATLRDTSGSADMTRRARLWVVKDRTWVKAAAKLKEVYSQLSSSSDLVTARSLASLTIGIIADIFTTSGLLPETNLLQLTPDGWNRQVQDHRLDALVVESAWEGGEGLWKGKVGFYDEESFADLKALLAYCRREGIPTIFWNKEDPVHFNRFRVTAKYFDHVFTTDDGCIPRYLEHPGTHLKSVASLPFYAQPRLHNPLASDRTYNHTISYAGSYYGDRYADRSRQLDRLLGAASPLGVTIYDRQHLNPDSPYSFPAHLARHVAGGLDYAEMVQAYKAHPIHINVNSVTDSQTMFSRRVVEIAASGGVIISGPGGGVQRVLGGTVPVLENADTAAALMGLWMSDESVRNDDAWLAMRTVFRAHTAGHRLAYALRTAGLVVKAPELESYIITVETLTKALASELSVQSVLPGAVVCKNADVEDIAGLPFDVRVIGEQDFDDALKPGESLTASLENTSVMDRTYFEDLLTSRVYVSWRQATVDESDVDATGLSMAQVVGSVPGDYPVMTDRASTTDCAVRLRRRIHAVVPTRASLANPSLRMTSKVVVVAGHDLKFATALIAELKSEGHTVLVDKWTDHNTHDEAHSRELLQRADVVFCEWTLGNAVWYSENKLPHQRIVSRLHLQEIQTPYLQRLNISNISKMIFVGQHLADIVVRDFCVDPEKVVVVPNYVHTESLKRAKTSDARWNLGLVGIVPERKRLDLALDVLGELRAEDRRYRLYIKGRRPEEYAWMESRPEEQAYFNKQYQRIKNDPLLRDAVSFDSQGDDMDEWYTKIGVVLSVSDFESFHLTLADGAASGALPVSLAWAGADQIYPETWIEPTVDDMVHHIRSTTSTDLLWAERTAVTSRFAARFDKRTVLPNLLHEILGS